MDAFRLGACLHRPSLLLSEGQKKRLVLAVALLRSPKHALLLDEPSLGQGAADKAALAQLLTACAQMGKTVVVATHDLEFVVDHVPRVVLLHEGRVVADGSTPQVLGQQRDLDRFGLALPPFIRRRLADQSPGPTQPPFDRDGANGDRA